MRVAVSTLITLLGLLSSLAVSAGPADSGVATDRIQLERALQATTRTARDLKALHYVENAHGQLDEWTNRLVSRLDLGLGPRLSDPMLDGRSGFQVLKLRITYAGYAESAPVIRVIEALADAHNRRLEFTRQMMDTTVDHERYAALSADTDSLITLIRNWSQSK